MNSSAFFDIIKPGLFTVWQDAGRPGFRHLGVPAGGAMDMGAYRRVNELLGLPGNHPVLECTMIGPEISFEAEVTLCISGAECEVLLDGNPVALHQSFQVRAGQTLTYGRFLRGCRSYIGIAAEIMLDQVMGSFSPLHGTHLQPLKKNDRIYFRPLSGIRIEPPADSDFRTEKASFIEVCQGPEWNWLHPEAQHILGHYSFSITHEANAVGYRMKGPVLEKTVHTELLSSAVLPGTVQLLPDGQIIILMRHCQTTGGYPRIIQLTEESIDILAQRRPGEEINFKVSPL